MVELCVSYEKVMGLMGVMENELWQLWESRPTDFWQRRSPFLVFSVGTLLEKSISSGSIDEKKHTWIKTSMNIAISKRRNSDSAHNVTPKCEENEHKDKRYATTEKRLKTNTQEANNKRRMKHQWRKTDSPVKGQYINGRIACSCL